MARRAQKKTSAAVVRDMPELPAHTIRRLDGWHGYTHCSVYGCLMAPVYCEHVYWWQPAGRKPWSYSVSFFGLCEVHGWLCLGAGDTHFEPDLVVQLPLFTWWNHDDLYTRGVASVRLGSQASAA